jgi:hypothetical protein
MIQKPRKLTINGKVPTPQQEADDLAELLGKEVVLYDQYGKEVARSEAKK